MKPQLMQPRWSQYSLGRLRTFFCSLTILACGVLTTNAAIASNGASVSSSVSVHIVSDAATIGYNTDGTPYVHDIATNQQLEPILVCTDEKDETTCAWEYNY